MRDCGDLLPVMMSLSGAPVGRRRAPRGPGRRLGLLLCVLALAVLRRPEAAGGAAPSLDMARAVETERMVRRALGIDPFLPGSLGDIIDGSLFPRPQRLARRRQGAKSSARGKTAYGKRGSSRFVPASSVASRNHVRTPANVLAVEHESSVFLMVASFQTDYVFKYNLGEGLGHPEVFASRVSCDMSKRFACTELSGPWGMAVRGNEFFVASFGTDKIVVLDMRDAKVLGEIGGSEELNGPEDLAIGPNGQYLFVSSYLGGEIVRYDVRTREYAGVFAEGLRGPEGLALMQSNILVAACNTDHSVRFFDTRDGAEIAAFVGSNVSLQYPVYARGSSTGNNNNSASNGAAASAAATLVNATKLEKPVVLWVGGDEFSSAWPVRSGRFSSQGQCQSAFRGFVRSRGRC